MENYVEIIKENLQKTSKHMWNWWIWTKMGDLKRACKDSGLYSENELKIIGKKLFWAGYWGLIGGRHFFNQAKEIIESKLPVSNEETSSFDDSIKNY